MNKISQVELEIAAHKNHCFSDIMDEAYGCKYGPDNECPANQDINALIDGLSLLEKNVLRDLSEISYDWFQGYSAIDFRGHKRNEIKKVIQKLKSLGLIEFARGLMYEDEYRTAGSGWRVVRKNSVIEYFENTESFDEAMLKYAVSLPVESYEKLKTAHDRELVGRYR